MVFNEEVKKSIDDTFRSVFSNKEAVKGLNASNSEMLKELSDELKVKKAVLTKAYSDWEKKIQDPQLIEERDQIIYNLFIEED